MQKKEQKISPIKQRILRFVESIGISKREFYAKIGVSRGTLESRTGITEDVLAKFIAIYSEVSIEWLITGKGEMIRDNPSHGPDISLIDAKNEIIRSQKDIILSQKELIEDQKEIISSLKGELKDLNSLNPHHSTSLLVAPSADSVSGRHRTKK